VEVDVTVLGEDVRKLRQEGRVLAFGGVPCGADPRTDAVTNGVTTVSLGIVLLKGVPINPQTTGEFVVGVNAGDAWICAFVRLSLGSAVWLPPKSILKIEAFIVIAVILSLMTNTAVPNEVGRGWPF
jgi:hypothetical protein